MPSKYKIGDRVKYTAAKSKIVWPDKYEADGKPQITGFEKRDGQTGTLTFVFEESKLFAGRIKWDMEPQQYGYDDLVYHNEIELITNDTANTGTATEPTTVGTERD